MTAAPAAANELVDALEGAGYRLTEPRRAVAEMVAGREGHFTAADLIDEARAPAPGARPRDRVPRARAVRVAQPRGARRPARPATTPTSPATPPTTTTRSAPAAAASLDVDDQGLADVLAAIGHRSGFRVTAHRLEIFGLCAACQAARRPAGVRRRAVVTARRVRSAGSSPPWSVAVVAAARAGRATPTRRRRRAGQGRHDHHDLRGHGPPGRRRPRRASRASCPRAARSTPSTPRPATSAGSPRRTSRSATASASTTGWPRSSRTPGRPRPLVALGEDLPGVDAHRRRGGLGRGREPAPVDERRLRLAVRGADRRRAHEGRSRGRRGLPRRARRLPGRASPTLDAYARDAARRDPGGRPHGRLVPRRVPVLRGGVRPHGRRHDRRRARARTRARATSRRSSRRSGTNGVKAIFAEAQFNPDLAQTIATETGATVVASLYTDSVGDAAAGHLRVDDALERRPGRGGARGLTGAVTVAAPETGSRRSRAGRSGRRSGCRSECPPPARPRMRPSRGTRSEPSSTPSTPRFPGSATTASSPRSTGSPAPEGRSSCRGGCAMRSRSWPVRLGRPTGGSIRRSSRTSSASASTGLPSRMPAIARRTRR